MSAEIWVREGLRIPPNLALHSLKRRGDSRQLRCEFAFADGFSFSVRTSYHKFMGRMQPETRVRYAHTLVHMHMYLQQITLCASRVPYPLPAFAGVPGAHEARSTSNAQTDAPYLYSMCLRRRLRARRRCTRTTILIRQGV